MTEVSVIITTFNDGQFLTRALESVAGQSARPKEVIVVDDGSDTDIAAHIASQFSSPDFSVRYVRQENLGPSSARNTGLRLATQKFLAFLDVDDVWLPSNLEHKLALLKSTSEDYLGAYGSFRRDDSNSVMEFAPFDGAPSPASVGKAGGFPGGAPAYLFRRDALLAVDGFDEGLFVNEDFDLLLRLLRRGYRLVGDSKPGFVRTMRVGSLTRNTNPLLGFNRVSKFLEKAAKEAYFSPHELDRRWKHARLAMVKGMLASGAGLVATAAVVRQGFVNPPPRSLVERVLLAASRVVLFPNVR